MTRREQILGAMGRQDPESIAFPAKGLYANSLAHIKDTDAAIFAVTNNQVMLGVEETARYVVSMAT
jgi:hypothetical protein